jgi:hypothetical protein
MKKLHYFIIISLFSTITFGQNGYYSTDSVTFSGVKLANGSDKMNARLCRIKVGDSIIQYTPDEVKAYGFEKGPEYISKTIQISGSAKRVFLECLEKGKLTLYYYKGNGIKTYFLENSNNSLIELPKHEKGNKNGDFKKNLLNITSDCSNITDATKLVIYRKNSLAELISMYNNCELKPFPHFRIGIFAGIESAKLIVPPAKKDGIVIFLNPNNLDYFNFTYKGGFIMGLNVDNPIHASDFSFLTGIEYSQHNFSYSERTNSYSILKLNAKLNTLKLPVILRYYSYKSDKYYTFCNIGGTFAYNINKNYSLYETTPSTNNMVIQDLSDPSMISKNMAGFIVGGGIAFNIDYRSSFFIELRFNRLYHLAKEKTFNISELNISTGISF